MGEIKLQINPKNRPAVPAVNWQQARVLEMQEEYAAAFDTSLVNTIEEMRAAYNEERKMWNTGGPVRQRQLTLMCRMKEIKYRYVYFVR